MCGRLSIGSIAKFFPQKQIEEILRASGREGQRRRKLPAMDLMYYLVALGLHASEGCRSVLRKVLLRKGSIEDEQVDRISSDSAISQARLGWEPLRALYLAVVQPIRHMSQQCGQQYCWCDPALTSHLASLTMSR